MSNTDLSIIIVNWNVKDLLRECLKSIYNTASGISFEIFVVDNASADGSIEMVKEEFPQVELIANKENLGFSKANNQAVKISNGKYILFLNPDTVVHPKAIEMMVNFLNANKNCGAVGPMIINGQGKIDPTGARNFPTVLFVFFNVMHLDKFFSKSKLFGRHLMTWWDHKDSRSISCLSGACMLVRREILEEVNFFDEKLPMFFEDLDLCQKIKKKGWNLYYLSTAKITHFQGSCSKKVIHRQTIERMTWKGHDLFFQKYYGRLHLWLHHIVLLYGALLNMIGFVLGFLLLLLMKKSVLNFVAKYIEMFKFSVSIGNIYWFANKNIDRRGSSHRI